MLYYASVSHPPTEHFVGGAFVNRPTKREASIAAAALFPTWPELQVVICPVPSGESVPADKVERPLTFEQLEEIFGPENLMNFEVAPDGSFVTIH